MAVSSKDITAENPLSFSFFRQESFGGEGNAFPEKFNVGTYLCAGEPEFCRLLLIRSAWRAAATPRYLVIFSNEVCEREGSRGVLRKCDFKKA